MAQNIREAEGLLRAIPKPGETMYAQPTIPFPPSPAYYLKSSEGWRAEHPDYFGPPVLQQCPTLGYVHDHLAR